MNRKRCSSATFKVLIWYCTTTSVVWWSEFLATDPEAPGSIPGHYKEKNVVGLERGPLSLVSTTEELFGSNSSGSCQERREYGRRDPSR
jgi:hypothetical protein